MSDMKWYIVHTYSGYENKAKLALEERIRTQKLDEQFEQVLIPMESVVEMVRGQRRTSKRKFFPGYMMVKMMLTDQTWHCVKDTPRVTGFIGNAKNPPPVPEHEVNRIIGQISEGEEAPTPKRLYDVGDHVRVSDGPFSGFEGVVEDVRPDKGKLRVLVSMFGRETPVELDFIQVEKTS